MDPQSENGESQPPSKTDISADEDTPSTELSPEEQMALYEKELKESDWGHQPC